MVPPNFTTTTTAISTTITTTSTTVNAFLYPPPYPGGRPPPEAVAGDADVRVGYITYPTLWGIGHTRASLANVPLLYQGPDQLT